MLMRRLWLTFSQAVTVAVAVVFVLATFKPDWLPSGGSSAMSGMPLPGLPGAAPVSDNQGDIVQALIALGYNEKEAALAIKPLPADVGVSDGIKLALKALAR